MKILVIGASNNPERMSNHVIQMLRSMDYEVFAIGREASLIVDVMVSTSSNKLIDIDTVTLYINPQIQPLYYEYLISLKPRRVIFNPGTENPEFAKSLQLQGIVTEEACTSVLLRTGQFN